MMQPRMGNQDISTASLDERASNHFLAVVDAITIDAQPSVEDCDETLDRGKRLPHRNNVL